MMTNHPARAACTPSACLPAFSVWLLLCMTVLVGLAGGSAQAQAAASSDPQTGRRVLVLGDSLSAAYGMAASQGWVARVDARLRAQGSAWSMVNASISGDTTAGGAARIVPALARHRPDVVVIELGANDALRGLPLADTRRNLAYMIGASHGAGARVLLVGMQMPPNLGRQYADDFSQGFATLSERYGTALLPFLLEPIASERGNFQADNLHPTATAQAALAEHVWLSLRPLLEASNPNRR